MESPEFDDMRGLLDFWNEASKQIELKNRINGLLDNQEFSLFFKKGKSVYGAPEESRVVFARMKNPDEDTPAEWANQASFLAINLDGVADGRGVQSLITAKDLPEIKIIPQDQAVEELTRRKK
jgi:hypothetical protein